MPGGSLSSRAMSTSDSLPERLNPWRLAAAAAVIEGQITLSAMPRLKEYLLPEENPNARSARVIMRFAQDSQRRVTIEGELCARLHLQCQRCLQGLEWPLQSQIKLVVVSDEGAASLAPREYEPLVVGPEGITSRELVEDELILAVPAVARCQDANCSQAPTALAAGNKSKNPFAVLRDMDFDNDTTN